MALKVASLKTLGPGRYSDNAHGPYFNVKPSGTRSWVQRLVIDGQRRTFGLGPYPVVSLSEARDIAIDNVRLRRRGINPIAERARSRMFARWAAAAVIDPELASACRETVEADASKNPKAWHATLMIRIVMQAWCRCVDSDGEDSDEDDDRIEIPLLWDGDARSAAAAGAAHPASLADIFGMPRLRVRRRPYNDYETRKLVAEAVRYCLSHGYFATRKPDRMGHRSVEGVGGEQPAPGPVTAPVLAQLLEQPG